MSAQKKRDCGRQLGHVEWDFKNTKTVHSGGSWRELFTGIMKEDGGIVERFEQAIRREPKIADHQIDGGSHVGV